MEKVTQLDNKTNFIQLLHSKFSDELSQVNKIILSNLECDEPLIKQAGEHLINSGGKRIRPLLTILASNLFNYQGNLHINLAAATEFIHAATLLHDDVVDSSKLRRFKPTVNSLYGNKTAILVGDFLFSKSFCLMVSTNSIKALNALSSASSIIAMGEVSQLSSTDNIITKQKYYEIISAKTAELFAASTEVGGIIADQSKQITDKLHNLGKNIGLIFQIKDDVLDYYSDNSKIGKNIGDDFFDGKVTLPIILLLDKVDKENNIKIKNIFSSKNNKSEDDLQYIINLLEEYNIIDELQKEIDELKSKSNIILNQIPNTSSEVKSILKDLIEFSAEREI